jgi:hypothetical protein
MFNFPILEVAIGLIFIYLILGLICSSLQELIASALKLRGKTLHEGIYNLLGNHLGHRFYDHALIRQLGRDGKSGPLPSYIAARTFTRTLLDLLRPNLPERDRAVGKALNLEELRSLVADVPEERLRTTLRLLLEEVETGAENVSEAVDAFYLKVENWFDESMQRVSGWYKRRAQAIMLLIAVGLAVALNVNSVEVARQLWTDPLLRQSVVAAAEGFNAPDTPVNADVDDPALAGIQRSLGNLRALQGELNALALPLGWSEIDPTGWGPGDWLYALLGWLLTAIAVSMGAPFWFNALGKLLQMRGSGGKPAAPPTTPTRISGR